ncbi:hypothetical protein E2C01_073577 [Portunus trituberculatus]|uniref:Uncharacterized protein n=1 Tax=Portunus trituberculatus TaxID=210409 RepID=A0A5B7IA37_PORTR|nr:hypothetical protein [Portunus trituberculatus]
MSPGVVIRTSSRPVGPAKHEDGPLPIGRRVVPASLTYAAINHPNMNRTLPASPAFPASCHRAVLTYPSSSPLSLVIPATFSPSQLCLFSLLHSPSNSLRLSKSPTLSSITPQIVATFPLLPRSPALLTPSFFCHVPRLSLIIPAPSPSLPHL